MKANVHTTEKNHQNPKQINPLNHHSLKSKFQEEDVLLWVDLNVSVTLIFTNNQTWLMTNHSYQSSITTYLPVKLIWRWFLQATVIRFNQFLVQGKYSTLILYIFNTVYFSMDKTIRKLEELNVVQDFYHMIN